MSSATGTFTYQSRLALTPTQAAVLDAYADLYGRVERSLFAAMCRGQRPESLKKAYLTRFDLTARQFNAVCRGLKGKVASIEARRPELIVEQRTRIAALQRLIRKLIRQMPADPDARTRPLQKLHQKKRRLAVLQTRLAGMEADERDGRIRLCFGGRKLFRAQFALEDNGYSSPGEWRHDWQTARSTQFFVLGSKDETAGCQGCVATVAEDGSLTLRLRLPPALAGGRYLEIGNARFAYGQERITAALACSHRVQRRSASGRRVNTLGGVAVSYRFLRDTKGWRVFVTTSVAAPEWVTHRQAGAIGVDLNADHWAVAEINRHGDRIASRRLRCITYGKTQYQALAVIGDQAKVVAEMAAEADKPVVIEKLDFARKKATLRDEDPRYARMLSSFAYNRERQAVLSACFRAGAEVIEVNPAYTSTIGAVNYARRYGITIHQGAAIAIARRGLGFSESPTVRQAWVPAAHGRHVTFTVPARNRSKHVWSFWAATRRKLTAALAAQARSETRPVRVAAATEPEDLPPWLLPGLAGAIPARDPSVPLFD